MWTSAVTARGTFENAMLANIKRKLVHSSSIFLKAFPNKNKKKMKNQKTKKNNKINKTYIKIKYLKKIPKTSKKQKN